MHQTPLTVRRCNVEDVPRLVPLFDAYRQFYRQPPNPEAAAAFLSARLRSGESVIWMAEIDDRAAGFTQLYPMFSSVRMQHLWILNDLFVDADARGLGVASALMAQAESFAKLSGAAAMLLETEASNTGAQALYEKRGWQRETNWHYALSFTPS